LYNILNTILSNETNDCLYERVIVSFNQLIRSQTLIHSRIK